MQLSRSRIIPKVYTDNSTVRRLVLTFTCGLCTVTTQNIKCVPCVVDGNGEGRRQRKLPMEKVDSQNLGQMIKSK